MARHSTVRQHQPERGVQAPSPSLKLVLLPDVLNAPHGRKERTPRYIVAFKQSYTLAEAERHEEALRLLRTAIRNKPDFVEAYHNYGVVLAETGRVSKAIAAFHKAIAIDPSFAEAHFALGAALFFAERFSEAAATFRKGITVKPDFDNAYDMLGAALAEAGELPEATDAFRTAVEIKPDYAVSHFNLGVVLGQNNQISDALSAIRKACELAPDDAGFQEVLQRLEPISDIGGALEQLGTQQNLDLVSPTPSYTGETPSPEAAVPPPLRMEDASAKIDELAALLPDEQRQAFKAKVAAAFAAAGITASANMEPRGDFNTKLAAREAARETTALAEPMDATRMEDTPLGRLQLRYQQRLAALVLPEGGFTTREQANAAARLSKTLHDLQQLQTKLRVEVTEKPDLVRDAERMRMTFVRTHQTTTAPARPRRALRAAGPSAR